MNTIYPPDEIQELFQPLLAEFYAVKNPRTNKPIKFSTSGRAYLYYRVNGNDYCYTPHPDTDGWYYSFAYIGIGTGARTGKAKRWTMKHLRPHRRRKDAKERAIKMQQAKKNGE
jgi:hypothetical protein